jgi:hypothetical protein
MPMSLFVALLFSLTAYAQFEDFENVFAPSNLTPKIGIICQTDVMFGKVDLVIDVHKGTATQVFGASRYVYQIDSFAPRKNTG